LFLSCYLSLDSFLWADIASGLLVHAKIVVSKQVRQVLKALEDVSPGDLIVELGYDSHCKTSCFLNESNAAVDSCFLLSKKVRCLGFGVAEYFGLFLFCG